MSRTSTKTCSYTGDMPGHSSRCLVSPPPLKSRVPFTFINLSGNQTHTDSPINKTVRSHVMRESRRQRKIEKRSRASRLLVQHKTDKIVPLGLRDAQDESNAGNFDGQTTASAEFAREMGPGTRDLSSQTEEFAITCRHLQQSPFTQFDGSADPFNVLALPSTPRVMMLLHSNLVAPIRTSVHADPTGRYQAHCTADSAWLYMTMSFAASRVQRQEDIDCLESTSYLLMSISLVNEHLADPLKRASDSTIATVSCLANLENLNGTSESGLIHIRGLQKMVELRGGLDNLGMWGILRRMVLWSDLCSAARSRSPPRFPLVEFEFKSLQNYYPPSTHTLSSFCPSGSLCRAEIQSHRFEILGQLQKLHELTTFLNLRPAGEDNLPPAAAYPDRVYSVEHTLLTALANGDEKWDFRHSSERGVIIHIFQLEADTNRWKN